MDGGVANCDVTNSDIKCVFIPLFLKKDNKNKYNKNKEHKVNSKKWNLTLLEKNTTFQCTLINQLKQNILNTYNVVSEVEKIEHVHLPLIKNNYLVQELTKLIKIKQSSYKHQDCLKNKYNASLFINFSDIVYLLSECNLICHYCSSDILIMYEVMYDPKQWTLDRIDNNLGHNSGNVLISCLECNLKRRLMHKNKFHFSKKVILTLNKTEE